MGFSLLWTLNHPLVAGCHAYLWPSGALRGDRGDPYGLVNGLL
jgi:hypothetical protein